MIIAKAPDGIYVTLADGEYLPSNLNNTKTKVFRQGDSTDRQLVLLKPLGVLAPELLRPEPPAKPVCPLSLLLAATNRPLHQHEDDSWWFYDVTFALEAGPFDTEAEAKDALAKYCVDYQKTKDFLLTIEQEAAKIQESQPPEEEM